MEKKNIPNEVWQAAAGMLSAYIPDITAAQVKAKITAESKESEFERPMKREEVRRLLGISMTTLHQWMREGRLEKIKIGVRASRISAASVRALMQNRTTGAEVIR